MSETRSQSEHVQRPHLRARGRLRSIACPIERSESRFSGLTTLRSRPESRPYTTGLAAGLAERGHDVQVLTGYPHYPQWKRDEASSGFRSDEEIDGVRVRRLSHHVPRDLSWMGRAAMELTFGLQLLTTRWGRPEVVVCVTPPLLAAAMSAIRARLTWRRPAVGVLVHDLYSRGVAETGAASGAVCPHGARIGIGGHSAWPTVWQ